jgi:hypothetical protein
MRPCFCWRPHNVGAPVVAFIHADAVACVIAVADGRAVNLAIACCCRHLSACATAVASVPALVGIPIVAGVPLVPDVITVCWPPDYYWRPCRCWRSAVAFVPAVAGVPAFVCVLAVASVSVDPIAFLFKLVSVRCTYCTDLAECG